MRNKPEVVQSRRDMQSYKYLHRSYYVLHVIGNVTFLVNELDKYPMRHRKFHQNLIL